MDGSPWGGEGGFDLEWRPDPQSSRTQQPFSYVAIAWTAEHERLTGASIGDPGSQGIWEAFSLLIALRLWIDVPYRGPIRILGDAEGVLAGMVKFTARAPLVNVMALEAPLILAPRGRQSDALHVWSEDNGAADDLSRVAQEISTPRFLDKVPRQSPRWDSRADWYILGHVED